MPRITRAALRTNRILEDEANLAAATPLPSTPVQERAPLGEIAGNSKEEPQIVLEVYLSKPAKAASKGKKATGAKKGRKPKIVETERVVEVLEDDCQSTTSSAVDEACDDLLREQCGEQYQIPMHDQRPSTPPSRAVLAARKRLSPKAHTPRFDPEIHKSSRPLRFGEIDGDSFVGSIETRTPARMASHELLKEVEKVEETTPQCAAPEHEETKDDSFVEQIVSRSPIKTVRTEDFVEAIDALEEALEKVGLEMSVVVSEEAQPAIEPKKVTANTKTKASTHAKKPVVKPVKAVARSSSTKVATDAQKNVSTKPTSAKSSAVASKPIAPRQASTPNSAVVIKSKSPPVKAKPSVSPTVTTKATAKPVTKFATQTRQPHARVSSISRAPFVPTKSTKAPTVSAFTLPSEAMTQKLKAAREARLQAQEAEQAAKREFKARPVSASSGPVVKPTAASKARLSMISGDSNPETASTKPRISSNPGVATNANKHTASKSKPVATPSKTGNLAVTKRPVPSKAASKAKISVPRVSASRPVSGVTAKQVEAVKKMGKETVARPRDEIEAKEKERKRKEDGGATKARLDAAERGRLASREWAEKMKARKASAAASGATAAVAVDKAVKA